jgi:hypothetical protein
MKQALLAITLLLAAAWWGGCGDPCAFEKQCPRTSTTVNGLDTAYYPYVRDFESDGKIYTYKITVDGNTFIRSYKMTDFAHKTSVELNPLHSDDCKIYTSCDTLITRWYEMEAKAVRGNNGLLSMELGYSEVVQTSFWDMEVPEGSITIYSNLIENMKKTNINSVEKDGITTSRFVKDTFIFSNHYFDVTVWQFVENGDDSTQIEIFNKSNSIIYYKNTYKNETIKLTEIR